MRFGSIAFGVGLVWLLACGKDAAPTDGDDEPAIDSSVSLQSACERYAAARCEREAECVASALRDAAYDCEAIAIRTCLAYGSPSSNVVPDDVEVCASRVGLLSCYELRAAGADCVLPPGKLATGAACAANTDCASVFCGKRDEECGVCAEAPLDDQPCTAFGCGPGRQCSAPTGGVCTTPKSVGARCDAQHGCLSTLVCLNAVCTPPSTVEGDTCGNGTAGCEASRALRCDDNDECRTFTPAASGQSCADGVHVGCVASNRCQAGTCVTLGEMGAVCEPGREGCAAGLACVGGKCDVRATPKCP